MRHSISFTIHRIASALTNMDNLINNLVWTITIHALPIGLPPMRVLEEAAQDPPAEGDAHRAVGCTGEPRWSSSPLSPSPCAIPHPCSPACSVVKSYLHLLSPSYPPSSLNKCSYHKLEKTAFSMTTASYTTPTLLSPAQVAMITTMMTSPSQIKRWVVGSSRSSSSRTWLDVLSPSQNERQAL